MSNIEKSALCRFLAREEIRYYGKVLELRDAVSGWLSYTTQAFPHYTKHTAEHSEEIVFQISKILFHDDNIDRPSVSSLSATEAYILVAAAYLHDSGMVVPDREKAEVLSSPDWIAWSHEDEVGARLLSIEQFRNGVNPADRDTRNFLADVQLRFLISEFMRRRHHLRAGDVVAQQQNELGRFAFGDPVLQKTIGDVCVSHGLDRRELDDEGRFPTVRDVQRDKVNVRFLAILLRLGDLLDVSHDRGCSLLLNAATPLPPDSIAHWSQYSAISHRSTSPERIEITAQCANQEEHRVLLDWCKWIEQETEFAATSMLHAKRHSGWKPPLASVSSTGTIRISPKPGAKYFFSNWRLEIDANRIIDMLVSGSGDSKAYVKEIAQNAFDAVRCRMYIDLNARQIAAPDSPQSIDSEIRELYPVKISVRWEQNEKTSGYRRQIVSFDDRGIGMNREVIERFFLQVGRSYYSSADFKRSFNFPPASGFGIGFLSTFSVSDHIVVETLRRSDDKTGEAIRLTLNGPRAYLLTEEGSRADPGTRIDIYLRPHDELKPGELTGILKNLCRRVEVPVVIDDFGSLTTIRP